MEKIIKTNLRPVQILVLGFAVIIFLGAFLLMLPISSQGNEPVHFVDAFFTATSAVCVTGLVVVDTGTYWSTFGQVVILLLIQVGGLGFMTMATSISILLGKKIGLRNRLIMQEALNQFSIAGVIRLTRYVVLTTLGIEGVGAFLLSLRFVPQFGLGKGIYYAIFHSVSAFCNAGFDIMGGGVSLMNYATDPLVNIVIVMLVIIGGLGFAVLADIVKTKHYRKYTLHSKLVITMTLILVGVGFIFMLASEFHNSATIGEMTLGNKLLASLFHAVTPRTAGFNTLNMAGLRTSTVFFTILLMFIGGSSGSTAGGIKTTTIGLIVLKVISVVRGDDDVEFSHRRVAKDTINRALAIFFIALSLVMIVILVLTLTESTLSFEQIVFESVSAFATVGLSLGITPMLSLAGKLIISAAMFFGRLGPLTIVLAISNHNDNYKKLIRYPEGKIMVG